MDGGQARFEVDVKSLGEPRPTSLDVFLERGDNRVAVECKFTESEFGTCSRVTEKASLCNGSYTRQLGRSSRCALTEIGVTYWEHAARVFTWPHDGDIDDAALNVPGGKECIRCRQRGTRTCRGCLRCPKPCLRPRR